MSKNVRPGWIIYPAAILLGVVIGAALSFATDAARAAEPTPTATVTTEATGSWTGDHLFEEVAAHAAIPSDRIPEAQDIGRSMCRLLVTVTPDHRAAVLEAARLAAQDADLGPNGASVVVEMGVRAYCPEVE